GVTAALEAMRFSDGECIQAFLEKYDRIAERDRECERIIETVALAADLDISHLWGEIMLAMREFSVAKVKVLAVEAHPEVMKKRIEFAKERGGSRDRDALDLILGALPKSSPSQFIDKVFIGAPPPDEEPEEKPKHQGQAELVDDIDFVFPDSEAMQEKLVGVR